MQVNVKDIKVKEGTVKAGANAGKPWKLIILIGEDGTEFTTFDTSAQEVGIGGVIELEPVIKSGKINFTEFKIIQKGTFQPTLVAGGLKDGMTPELWAEKDQRELFSREGNACFMGLPDLINCQPTDEKGKEARGKALDWAMAHFQTDKPAQVKAQKPPPEPTKSTPATSPPVTDTQVFADAGKLKTAMQNQLKMTLAQIEAATAGFNLTTEQGRKDCWASILAVRSKSDEEKPVEEKEGIDPQGHFE